MSAYRVAAGAVEETKRDPFPAAEAPPSEEERLRRLKVAAAAIAGSGWTAHCAAERIVKSQCGGRFEPSREEIAVVVDESIAVMEIAIAQWKAAR